MSARVLWCQVDETELEAAASAMGYGAVKYADLKNHRSTNYKFSYDDMLSLKGNTAVYLLYAHARIAGAQGAGAREGPAVWPCGAGRRPAGPCVPPWQLQECSLAPQASCARRARTWRSWRPPRPSRWNTPRRATERGSHAGRSASPAACSAICKRAQGVHVCLLCLGCPCQEAELALHLVKLPEALEDALDELAPNRWAGAEAQQEAGEGEGSGS